MNYTIDCKIDAEKDWNSFLLDSETGTITHTIEYSEYVRRWVGWKPFFLRMTDSKGNIMLQCLLFEYSPGLTRIPAPFNRIYKKFKNSLRWHYGPVSISKETSLCFFNYLKENKKNFYGTTHPLCQAVDPDLTKELWATYLIDPQKTTGVIYENIDKHSAKKNIKRSIDRGVVIDEISEKTIKEYLDLLNQYKITTDRKTTEFEEMYDYWKLLKPIGLTGFLARKDGIPVGGMMISYFNKYINEQGIARSKLDLEEKLYSQDLLKWRVIEWGIKNKMRWYDLSGFNPNPKSKKEEGIMRYKSKWGGIQKNYWIVRG